MDKRAIESFKAHCTRKALRGARFLVKMRVFLNKAPTVRAPELTPNQLDRLMHRRLDQEAARKERAAQVFGRKKKLPLPSVRPGDSRIVAEAMRILDGAEQVRPRVLSDREWAAQDPTLREGTTTHIPGVGDV